MEEEDKEEEEEKKLHDDIEKLRTEQAQDSLSAAERVMQFEKLAEVYSRQGKLKGAHAFRREAEDIKRVERLAEASGKARKAKEEEEQAKEAERIAKLKEISKYVSRVFDTA